MNKLTSPSQPFTSTSTTTTSNKQSNHHHHSDHQSSSSTSLIKSNINTSNTNANKSTPHTMTFNVKYEHLVAGISGGVASTLALHPLDLLKVRLAVNDGQISARPQYSGLINAVSTIYRHEGFRGFYRGVTPNCWGAGTSWGLYFLFYNAIKSHMSNVGDIQLNAGQHILAASEAGVMTLVLTNPIWVVKTRLCLQYGGMSENAVLPTRRYKGMLDALMKIYRFEGIRGLYRGFVPGIFGVSHGALQFMAYEELKRYYIEHYNLRRDERLGTFAYLGCAASSKLFAAIITYPYQVVRARLQDQYANYSGVMDVIKRTWRYETIRGFYKGLAAYLIHVTPNICIVFLIYEHFTGPKLKFQNNNISDNDDNSKLSISDHQILLQQQKQQQLHHRKLQEHHQQQYQYQHQQQQKQLQQENERLKYAISSSNNYYRNYFNDNNDDSIVETFIFDG